MSYFIIVLVLVITACSSPKSNDVPQESPVIPGTNVPAVNYPVIAAHGPHMRPYLCAEQGGLTGQDCTSAHLSNFLTQLNFYYTVDMSFAYDSGWCGAEAYECMDYYRLEDEAKRLRGVL